MHTSNGVETALDLESALDRLGKRGRGARAAAQRDDEALLLEEEPT